MQYFRVFGCKCFVLKKGARLSKFDTRAFEGRFVGYAWDSHAFRVYDPTHRRVIESSNVEFEENDGSQVGQDGVCAGDVTPSEAIKSMGVGFYRPIEGPPLVEPSPSQDHQDHEDSSDEDQEQDAS